MVKRFLCLSLLVRGVTSGLSLAVLFGCANVQLTREPISLSGHSSLAKRNDQMVKSNGEQNLSRLVAVGRLLTKRKINFSMTFDDTIPTQSALSIGGIGVIRSSNKSENSSAEYKNHTSAPNVEPHVWSQTPASYPPPVLPYSTFYQYQYDQTSKMTESPAKAASKAW